tara:strand:- start:206 stop:331 length:126 start_codon:yes stop_codon:yes gene_type:complete
MGKEKDSIVIDKKYKNVLEDHKKAKENVETGKKNIVELRKK